MCSQASPDRSQIELSDLDTRPAVIVSQGERGKEFFVPVSEHKKSFRGEKMLVHQQKTRRSTNSCRHLCCWFLGLALLAGAIAVAVLIGSRKSQTSLSLTIVHSNLSFFIGFLGTLIIILLSWCNRPRFDLKESGSYLKHGRFQRSPQECQ